jgi:hypothetical protein
MGESLARMELFLFTANFFRHFQVISILFYFISLFYFSGFARRSLEATINREAWRICCSPGTL